jgi:hypothetical protein
VERIPRETEKLFLIRPKDRLVLLYINAGHNIVEMHNNIFSSISNNHEEASFLFLNTIANERGDPRISMNWLVLGSGTRACEKYTAFRTIASSPQLLVYFPLEGDMRIVIQSLSLTAAVVLNWQKLFLEL